MAELIFFKRPDILDEEHALYFKDLLFRTAKVGTELEFAMPKEVKREEFQPKVEALLKPSRSLAMLGESGVLDVAKEHCGAEVRIIGRYPYYDVLIDQYEHIISALLPLGIRARPTCGLHFHLLTTWFAHSIPEIVLANLWNLATSDTSHLSTDDLEELSTGCEEMLKFLKPAFARFENPALRVLRFLARRPISFMRSDGLGWEEIERLLSKQAAAERRNHLDSTDERLVRIIELGDIKGQPDDDRWLNRVADTLWIPRADLDLRMKRLARRKPRWDAEMGSYIFLR
ncbi:hypothetical protein KAX06_00655 [candidate division WOR-3 bacterium]|nr:hypothetical protein [candidate division WOR-3 bacterium]